MPKYHLMRISLVALFLWAASPLLAQQKLSDAGRFRVDIGKSCAPVTVTATNLFPFTGTVEYEVQGTRSTNTVFTFNSPGNYTIVQIGGTVTTELRDTVIVEVMEDRIPEFAVINCASKSAALQITDSYYDRFAVYSSLSDPDADTVLASDPDLVFDYSSTTGLQNIRVVGLFDNAFNNCGEGSEDFTPVNTLSAANVSSLEVSTRDSINGAIRIDFNTSTNVTYQLERSNPNSLSGYSAVALVTNASSYTDSLLNTVSDSWCYRIVALDACSGTRLNSDTICSPTLQAEDLTSNQLVTWTSSPLTPVGFTLFRDDTTVYVGADSLYLDQNVICNQTYCYQVEVRFSNGLSARSGTLCRVTTGEAVTLPIEFITASIDGGSVALSWEPSNDAVERYQVYRRPNGQLSSLINSTSNPSFQTNYQALSCYQIGYEDQCGNIEPQGIDACPVYLEIGEDTPAQANLSWSAYTGWQGGVTRYIVERYDADGNLVDEQSVGLAQSYDEDMLSLDIQSASFRIRAVSAADESIVAYSNLVTIDKAGGVILPEAFTPNNDGRNDFLLIFTFFVDEYELILYNRWGEAVFQTNSTELNQFWDGTYRGVQAPAGLYSFRVRYTDAQGRENSGQGAVRLIR